MRLSSFLEAVEPGKQLNLERKLKHGAPKKMALSFDCFFISSAGEDRSLGIAQAERGLGYRTTE